MEFVVWLCDKLADVVSAAENYENYERRFWSKVMLIAVDAQWVEFAEIQSPPAIYHKNVSKMMILTQVNIYSVVDCFSIRLWLPT